MHCDNLFSIFEFPLVTLILCWFYPQYFVEILLSNVFMIYFINNSLTVYFFEDEGIIKSHRIFRKKKQYIPYSEIENITFDRLPLSWTYFSHKISINTIKGIKLPILPNISVSDWNDVENVISFLKDKNVKLIILE